MSTFRDILITTQQTNKDRIELIDELAKNRILSKEDFVLLLDDNNESTLNYLREIARRISKENFGNSVYLRGLIEYSNYCVKDCYYCGLRYSNENLIRYRMSKSEIMECCDRGYLAGLRTFVIQGGEDERIKDSSICLLISEIKDKYKDCAVTLSLGEKSRKSYEAFYNAGADRYLLRHETATEEHYRSLHPKYQTLSNRVKCLYDLKEIGYQIGAGFMVGTPAQTSYNIANDFYFLHEINPHMIGIGPFIHNRNTPFGKEPDGSVVMTLKCLSILRIMFPNVLIPATTALETSSEHGYELGIMAGANVIMPNISPLKAKINYRIYEKKYVKDVNINKDIDIDSKCREINDRLKRIGYKSNKSRGDYFDWRRK